MKNVVVGIYSDEKGVDKSARERPKLSNVRCVCESARLDHHIWTPPQLQRRKLAIHDHEDTGNTLVRVQIIKLMANHPARICVSPSHKSYSL